jgi:hypothetical protein
MGEKGIDPGAALPNPGLGMTALPHLGGEPQMAPSQSEAPPKPADPPAGDPVGDAIVDVLDPLGIHKLF